MINVLKQTTADLASFLGAELPRLSDQWWSTCVVDRLSFQQQRTTAERGITTLRQLDLAALLRVLDQNWFELSALLSWPRDGRNWVKELQTIRNKWAHASSEEAPPNEAYPDADTLARVLNLIGASNASMQSVESEKRRALEAMAPASPAPAAPASEAPSVNAPQRPATLFKPGDIVALRADPTKLLPIVEVVPGGGECRYHVFETGAKAIYYESQLQPAASADDETLLSADDLRTHLTSLQILSPSTASGLIGSKESDLGFQIVSWRASLPDAQRHLLHDFGLPPEKWSSLK